MNEMDLLEQFCAAVPPPESARLSPARATLLTAANTAGRPAHPPRTRIRLTWPRGIVMSAAVAAAVAVVLVLTLATPVGGKLTPPASAATLLQRAAKAALSQPAATAGQYIYTEVTAPGETRASAVVRTWQSVDGSRQGVVETQGTCGPLGTLRVGLLPGETPLAFPSNAATAQAAPAPRPAPLGHCSAIIRGTPSSPPASTYAGLQTLPTDPAVLLQYLGEHYQPMLAPGEALSPAAREYLAISDILENLGVLPGRLEAAMFQALRLLPGMQTVSHVTDYAGREGTAAAWTNDGYEFELIFNPATYQFMGQQEIALAGNGRGYAAGARVWGMSLLASGVTSTVPSVQETTQFCALLWQDFASGLPAGC